MVVADSAVSAKDATPRDARSSARVASPRISSPVTPSHSTLAASDAAKSDACWVSWLIVPCSSTSIAFQVAPSARIR